MTTILTEIGWEDENGISLGTWTNRADLVNEDDRIVVATGVIANTLGGDDTIIGTSDFTPLPSPPAPPPGIQLIENSGITSRGTIKTGNGSDNINGTGVGFGIGNRGIIETGNGNDNINGTGNCVGIFNSALDNLGIIETGNGNDNINGTGSAGIVNFGTIKTGNGSDDINGTGDLAGETPDEIPCAPINFNSALVNIGMIDTGRGNDNIIGTNGESEGIENRSTGTIKTGNGNDNIIGSGDIAGLTNLGTINTGNGKDQIIGTNLTGSGEDIAGINNTGTIDTGKGNDIVDALTGGFASFGLIPVPEGDEDVGTINLGQGKDLIRGFGEQIVDGGRGFDTAELGIDFDENLITFGSTGATSIDITFDSATMSFTDVELFDFNGQEFALEQLQDMV